MSLKLNKAQALLVEHLMTHHAAAGFAGLGVGKTLATLKAFSGLKAFGDVETMMVVAPIRVCNLTWPNEVRKWPGEFGHLRVANLRTDEGRKRWDAGKADLVLCNYEMLPKVAPALAIRRLQPDVICFDELTRAKNPKSKRIEALRRTLSPRTRRWGLTGTPIPNGYLDLFAQIRLLDDGERLGKSFDHFKRTHFHPIDYMEYDWRLNEGADKLIQGRIADICLTLLAKDYGVEVPINEVDIEVPLPDKAREQYDTLEKELILSMGEDPENAIVAPSAGVLVNKLLQVCSGMVYNEKREVVRIHEAKLDAAENFLTSRGPTMVVYNYRHELEALKKLRPNAVPFEDAKTDEAQHRLERDWNEGKIHNLLVHPQSVGHGLNLQYGPSTDILWFSPTWSREAYDQLNGRMARQGQKAPSVNVTRLLCPGTMDDAVVETLRSRDEGQRGLLTALRNLRQLKAV